MKVKAVAPGFRPGIVAAIYDRRRGDGTSPLQKGCRPEGRRSTTAILLGALFTVAIITFFPAASRAASKTGEKTLQGKLVTVPKIGPALQSNGKNYPLAGRNQYILHTLQDQRLQNKELRVEGAMRADGNFQVNDFYTLHGGKLYRVRYYCETCNIAALQPGDCVCCQQPTELQEVPVDPHDKNVLITH